MRYNTVIVSYPKMCPTKEIDFCRFCENGIELVDRWAETMEVWWRSFVVGNCGPVPRKYLWLDEWICEHDVEKYAIEVPSGLHHEMRFTFYVGGKKFTVLESDLNKIDEILNNPEYEDTLEDAQRFENPLHVPDVSKAMELCRE